MKKLYPIFRAIFLIVVLSLVITILPVLPVVRANATNLNHNYPRLANYFLMPTLSTDRIDSLKKWDLLILSAEFGYDSSSGLNSIRAQNPNVVLLPYVNTMLVVKRGSYNYDRRYNYLRLLAAEASGSPGWWLYDQYGNQVSTWPGTWNLNLSDVSPIYNGKRWSNYLSDFVHYEVMRDYPWDGIFYDDAHQTANWMNGGNLDLNNDRIKDSSSYINEHWGNGLTTLFSRSRTNEGTEKIIIGNGGYTLYGYGNGRLFENFPKFWSGATWDSTMQEYFDWMSKGFSPQLAIINGNNGNTGDQLSNLKNMRFTLTSTLLGDGYFSCDYGDTSHGQLWWYDEYSVDVNGNATGDDSSKGYLGQPKGEAYKLSNGTWRRDFDYGTALVNPTSQTQTVNLEKTYKKIKGTQAPEINDGSLVNSVTVSNQDGIILLDPNSVSASPDTSDGITRYEETSSSIEWTGYWKDLANPDYSGGSRRYTRYDGDSATLTFTGTSVSWIGSKNPSRGIAKVYIDGIYQRSTDNYSPLEEFQQVIYTKTGLSPGTHTIMIEATGSKNPLATDTVIDVDAFDVGTLDGTRFEEASSSVAYTSTWTNYSNSAYSGGSTKYSNQTGATATFAFTGTSVTLIAAKASNRGIAKVYIDSVYQASVDLYSSTGIAQQAVYTKTGLTSGAHTIKIEVTGTKNASASGTVVDVDAFDVGGAVTDTTPPSAPTNLTATAISSSQINLSWTASTDNLGVTGYKIERSLNGTTGWAQIGTTSSTTYSSTGLSSSTTYYYRVRAYDAAGNNSAYSNTASATTLAPSVVTRYEEASCSYTSTWTNYSNSAYSGGSTKYSNQTGATATFAFTGTSVTLIAAKASNRGIAKVYIDSVYQASVDLYSSTGIAQQAVYTKTGLTSGAHTIKIEVTGTKNASSSGTVVDVDAFDVLNP